MAMNEPSPAKKPTSADVWLIPSVALIVAPGVGWAIALALALAGAAALVAIFAVPPVLTAGVALARRCGFWSLTYVLLTGLVCFLSWLAVVLYGVTKMS